MTNPVQKKFDNPSKLFIWLYSFGNYFRSRSYYDKLLNELNLHGNESVMDFGSGVGSLARKLALKLQHGGQLTCVDVSKNLLDHTRHKLKKYNNISYFLGAIENSTLEAESFDIIVSTWVFHHLDKANLSQTITKLRKLLKKDGKIYIIEFPDSKYNHTKLLQSDLIDFFTQLDFTFRIIFSQKQGILYEFVKSKSLTN